MERPAATVVIATAGREQLLADTVESVLRSTVTAEILVVDQRRDGLAPLHREGVRVIPTTTFGLSYARNLGASKARSDVLVFLDDDILVEPHWLEELLAQLEQAGAEAAVTGQVQPGPPERPRAFRPASVVGDDHVEYRGRLDRDVLAGGNMAVHRAFFDRLRGFDERLGAGGRYPAAEDNDLCFRVLESGGTIVYAPNALVVHRAWRGRRHFVLLRWRYGRGKGGFYAKHASLRDRHMLDRMRRDLGARLRAFPRHLAADRRRALGDLCYCAGMLVAFAQWLLTERGR